MLKILTYNEIDKRQWQALVDQSPTASWFQTPEAYEFYMSVLHEIMPFAVGVSECKVESVKCKGTENGRADALVSRLIALSPHRLTPIYIETRNFHDYSKWRHIFEQCGFAYQPHLNIQVTCNVTHSMSDQRIRQVKKAIKNGAEIAEAQS